MKLLRDAEYGCNRRHPHPGNRLSKVERFIRYLRASFYVPRASQLSPEGLKGRS
jgi:hypothetical protein